MPDKEYCLLFREEGTHLLGGYESKKTFYVQNTNVNDKNLYSHPTIKPLNIIKNMIINSSNENGIIADFFLGSGTTCAAAKELKRNYIGFEIDKEYYEIAKKRLNNETANGQFMLDLFS